MRRHRLALGWLVAIVASVAATLGLILVTTPAMTAPMVGGEASGMLLGGGMTLMLLVTGLGDGPGIG